MSNARDKANIPALNFSSTGIDDNATSTAITIDSSQNVEINVGNVADSTPLIIKGGETDLSPLPQTIGMLFGYSGASGYNKTGLINEFETSAGLSALHIVNNSTANSSDASKSDKRITIDYNGDISFYEDTGTTAKFFWDASAERLGIGTSSPDMALEVRSDVGSSGTVAKIMNSNSTYSNNIDFKFNSSKDVTLETGSGTGAIVLEPGSRGVIINESGGDKDFRVESNNQSHMLFVDGGKDAVAIGNSDSATDAALNVTQLDNTKPIQTLRGNDAADGAKVRSIKILRHIPVVSLGTKLIIPFISQSSFNVNHLITLRGKTAEYNSSNAKAFEVLFQVGSITSLSSFSVLRSGGTYSSATTNGMNVEITFNTNYTHATEDGVIIEMDILGERTNLGVDVDGIVMN